MPAPGLQLIPVEGPGQAVGGAGVQAQNALAPGAARPRWAVDPSKINCVALRGGGEPIAAILGGNVAVRGSGYSEFAGYISSGTMKALAVTSATRLKGIDVPTLQAQGINVVIGNWRGVYGAPGITPGQCKPQTFRVAVASQRKIWAEALAKSAWTAERSTAQRLMTLSTTSSPACAR